MKDKHEGQFPQTEAALADCKYAPTSAKPYNHLLDLALVGTKEAQRTLNEGLPPLTKFASRHKSDLTEAAAFAAGATVLALAGAAAAPEIAIGLLGAGAVAAVVYAEGKIGKALVEDVTAGNTAPKGKDASWQKRTSSW